MPSRRRDLAPFDRESLDRLALRYVEKYQTTRAKLEAYLTRKIRERGCEGTDVDPAAAASRMADLGYVNDRAFAEAKARSMARRGLGARRIAQALYEAGIDTDDAAALQPEIEAKAIDAALAFARRKRIGPFAPMCPDRIQGDRQIAQMVRAGHEFGLAQRVVNMAPNTNLETLSVDWIA